MAEIKEEDRQLIQCPSCKIRPHRQACSRNCEDARITAAFASGEEQAIERAARMLEVGEWLATPEAADTARLLGLATKAVRSLSPDPDYTARIRREALEEAATIAVGHQLKGHNGEKCGQPGQLVCGIAIASEIQALIKK